MEGYLPVAEENDPRVRQALLRGRRARIFCCGALCTGLLVLIGRRSPDAWQVWRSRGAGTGQARTANLANIMWRGTHKGMLQTAVVHPQSGVLQRHQRFLTPEARSILRLRRIVPRSSQGAGTEPDATWATRMIKEIYSQKNPDKLEEMPRLLAKYIGRERLLYEKVCEKYDVQPERSPADIKMVAECTELIQELYSRRNPGKLEGLPQMLEKWAGRERQLYESICKKYEEEPKKMSSPKPFKVTVEAVTSSDPAEWMEQPVVDELKVPLRIATFSPLKRVGITANWSTGRVLDIVENAQADKQGVQIGWDILEVDNEPFSEEKLDAKMASSKEFDVTFSAHPYGLDRKPLRPCISGWQRPNATQGTPDAYCSWGGEPEWTGSNRQVCVVLFADPERTGRLCVDAWTWAYAVTNDPDMMGGMGLICKATNRNLRQFYRSANLNNTREKDMAITAYRKIVEICDAPIDADLLSTDA